MTLSVGSVCSGIGAPETAWAPLGWDYLWSSDIEPFPNAVRAAHYQGVPNLGDMTGIAPRILAGEIAAPDILVGGTPCQSFSVAGLRKGLADDRGNLALEFIRLADAIDAVRRAAGKPPAWILWENVPGVLSDSGNAFGAFLAGMVGGDAPLVPRGRWTDAGVVHGPGRCAAWRILDAQFFGLAQRRERVFVLARGGAGAWAAADALLPVIESVRWHPAPRREAGKAVARPVAAGSPRGSGYRNDADTADNLTPAVATTLRARDGKGSPDSDCTSTLLAFGGNNTRGPIDVAAALNACATASGRQDFETETFITDLAPPLTAQTLTAARGAACANAADLETYIPVAGAICRDSFSGGAGGRPEGADAGHYVAAQPVDLQNVALGGEIAGTLDTTRPGRGGGQALMQGMAVRRLTPRECERLQGFPDDATAVTYRGKPAADGPRYRALGNSMAVPVLAWIGRRIQDLST